MKKALITGITGQDGSYLSELLLKKGYEVHGLVRRTSTVTTQRLGEKTQDGSIETHYGDLADTNSIVSLIAKIEPDEIYNIGSMSHVRVSFDIPEYTAQVTGIGCLRILEALRSLGAEDTKFYQASSSEMFGASLPPQNEAVMFQPLSPYGAAKLYAYWMTRAYRTGYNMFACNGILFNHESPRRGETFVTMKIVRAAVRIKLGKQNNIMLGNLDAKRDWGHAKDYVRAIYMIMQHWEPDDFVVSTGEYWTVKEFAELTFSQLGLNFYDYLITDDRFRRPNEVPALLGDSTKIREVLGWKSEYNFDELVEDMINHVMKEEMECEK